MRASEPKRPKMRRIADRLGAWYTPVALTVAAFGQNSDITSEAADAVLSASERRGRNGAERHRNDRGRARHSAASHPSRSAGVYRLGGGVECAAGGDPNGREDRFFGNRVR